MTNLSVEYEETRTVSETITACDHCGAEISDPVTLRGHGTKLHFHAACLDEFSLDADHIVAEEPSRLRTNRDTIYVALDIVDVIAIGSGIVSINWAIYTDSFTLSAAMVIVGIGAILFAYGYGRSQVRQVIE